MSNKPLDSWRSGPFPCQSRKSGTPPGFKSAKLITGSTFSCAPSTRGTGKKTILTSVQSLAATHTELHKRLLLQSCCGPFLHVWACNELVQNWPTHLTTSNSFIRVTSDMFLSSFSESPADFPSNFFGSVTHKHLVFAPKPIPLGRPFVRALGRFDSRSCGHACQVVSSVEGTT